VDYLILPYTADLDHWTDIEHFTKSTVYEALAFVQHYGLPTAFIDFTDDLDIASSFAAQGAPATLARIAVLDAAHAAKFGDTTLLVAERRPTAKGRRLSLWASILRASGDGRS
jgi:hypothetical protein